MPRLPAFPLNKFTLILCSHVSKPNSQESYRGLHLIAKTGAENSDPLLLRGRGKFLKWLFMCTLTEVERATLPTLYRPPETR